jgi:HAD superfamily hydrolase (TIGR01509 family)
MRQIQAVTFDLWGTLIRDAQGSSDIVSAARINGMARYLHDMGMAPKRAEVASAYVKSKDFLDMTWSKMRDMPAREQVLFILTCVDCRLPGKLDREDINEIERIYSESILQRPPELVAEAREVLKEIRSKGYRMGLISNTGRTPGSALRKVMEQLGILKYFDATVFSNEILVRKPAEAAFTVTLGKLRVAPRASVHIGDEARSDIEGATRAGMHAIHVVHPEGTPSKLADARVDSLELVPEKLELIQNNA